jgi:hypothetical protein
MTPLACVVVRSPAGRATPVVIARSPAGGRTTKQSRQILRDCRGSLAGPGNFARAFTAEQDKVSLVAILDADQELARAEAGKDQVSDEDIAAEDDTKRPS